MINWFNMPVEGLSNGGQFEIKELTATENKTYEKDGEVYSKVTVNVEGGGGSSDFTTAKVTLQPAPEESFLGASATTNIGYFLSDENGYSCTDFRMLPNIESEILLYQGEAILTINTVFDESTQPTISPHFAIVSGDVVQDEDYDDTFYVSGDCVIRVSTK